MENSEFSEFSVLTPKDLLNFSYPMNENNSSPTENQFSYISWFLLLSFKVNRFYTPSMCLFGIVGNIVSLVVFSKSTNHRSLSSSYYLSALAISDTGFLINLLVSWFEEIGYSTISIGLLCPLIIYLSQISCFLSVWFTVAFTVERFFAVCYPLTRPRVCTVARARKIIAGIVFIGLVAFIYVLVIARSLEIVYPTGEDEEEYSNRTSQHSQNVTSENKTQFTSLNITEVEREKGEILRVCTVPVEYHFFSNIANYVDSSFTLVIPFLIISSLNIKIAICVWQLKRQRKKMTAEGNLTKSRKNPGCVKLDGETEEDGDEDSHHHNPNLKGWRVVRNTIKFLRPFPSPKRREDDYSDQPSPNGSSAAFQDSNNVLTQLRSTVVRRVRGKKRKGNSTIAESRVTKMLLLVSTVFLVLNTPAHLIRLFMLFQLIWSKERRSPEFYGAQQWSNILFNTNFSVNFILYCLSGRNFRESLKTICLGDGKFRIKGKRSTWKERCNSRRTNEIPLDIFPSPTELKRRDDIRPQSNSHESSRIKCTKSRRSNTNESNFETEIELCTVP